MIGITDLTEEIAPTEALLKAELPQLELVSPLQIGCHHRLSYRAWYHRYLHRKTI